MHCFCWICCTEGASHFRFNFISTLVFIPPADSVAQVTCDLNAEGAKAIAAAIQVNTTVERVDLVSYIMKS